MIAAIADDRCADALVPGLDKQYFKEEIRAALGESAESVNNRLLLAAELTRRLPSTLAALEDGPITLRHARHLADAVRALDSPDASEVKAALADRRMWMRPDANRMCLFGALLPADGAQALMTALDMKADQCSADDPRTIDQRRADAPVQLALDAPGGPPPMGA